MANELKTYHGSNVTVNVHFWDGTVKNKIALGAELSYRVTGSHWKSNGFKQISVLEHDTDHRVATLTVLKGCNVDAAVKALLAGNSKAWFDVSCNKIPSA